MDAGRARPAVVEDLNISDVVALFHTTLVVDTRVVDAHALASVEYPLRDVEVRVKDEIFEPIAPGFLDRGFYLLKHFFS